MKTILVLIITLSSLISHAQGLAASPNELIPFYFEKSGVQISVLFRHSLIYASTRSLMVGPSPDTQPNPYLSFEFLPVDKYYACAAKQLESLQQALRAKEVMPLKNKFQSIQLTVLISPTTAAATFCPTIVRSSQKQLVIGACLDDSATTDLACQTVSTARLTEHYTKRASYVESMKTEEARMKKAAEGLLQWMGP